MEHIDGKIQMDYSRNLRFALLRLLQDECQELSEESKLKLVPRLVVFVRQWNAELEARCNALSNMAHDAIANALPAPIFVVEHHGETIRELEGMVASASNNWSPAGSSPTYCKFCGRDTAVCIAEPCEQSARNGEPESEYERRTRG